MEFVWKIREKKKNAYWGFGEETGLKETTWKTGC